jgi:hypothetical protein
MRALVAVLILTCTAAMAGSPGGGGGGGGHSGGGGGGGGGGGHASAGGGGHASASTGGHVVAARHGSAPAAAESSATASHIKLESFDAGKDNRRPPVPKTKPKPPRLTEIPNDQPLVQTPGPVCTEAQRREHRCPGDAPRETPRER